jgi:acetoin utilization deacetylase AcuC-like enzyme
MTTILMYEPAPGHTWANHPENEQRLTGMLSFLEENGVLGELERLSSEPAGGRQVTRVHTAGLVERVRALAARGGGNLDPDTYVTGQSYELALQAAGSCSTAVDALLTGRGKNGIALVRPPGHHAERERAGGFCLFNNVAIAARQAQAVHGIRRIMIVDYDVHHGNGTQDIFYDDENVLYLSTHLYHPFFYPGTGAATEIGRGAGRGTTVNVPFPRGVGDRGYRRAFEAVLVPSARAFRPELILVSVGFDAHWRDPLASAALSLTGYAVLSQILLDLADEQCSGRILFVLEGGYFQKALQYGILNLTYGLTGRDEIVDPLGPMPGREQAVGDLIERLQSLHMLG